MGPIQLHRKITPKAVQTGILFFIVTSPLFHIVVYGVEYFFLRPILRSSIGHFGRRIRNVLP